MARLIKCPTCGHEMSDQAFNKCSNCGYRLPFKINPAYKTPLIVIGIFLLILFIVWAIGAYQLAVAESRLRVGG